MELVSSTSFQTLANRHKGDYKVKGFSCWKQVFSPLLVLCAWLTNSKCGFNSVVGEANAHAYPNTNNGGKK